MTVDIEKSNFITEFPCLFGLTVFNSEFSDVFFFPSELLFLNIVGRECASSPGFRVFKFNPSNLNPLFILFIRCRWEEGRGWQGLGSAPEGRGWGKSCIYKGYFVKNWICLWLGVERENGGRVWGVWSTLWFKLVGAYTTCLFQSIYFMLTWI